MSSAATHYDTLIIGFGKGGKTLAHTLALRGQKVALVEASAQMYGGTCINVGCIPSKTLKAAADRAAACGPTAQAFAQAAQRKTALTAAMRQANYDKVAKAPGASVITGRARFVSPTQVQVDLADGGQQTLSAGRIVINTGATPAMPPIEGLAGNPHVLDSTGLMALQALPQQLVVVGGGFIGLEFASTFRSFGSQVTVLEAGAEFLPREDRDMAAAVLDSLRQRGIEVLLGQQVTRIEQLGAAASAVHTRAADGSTARHEGQAILIAAGRAPATRDLGLDAAGVATDARGFVQVNDHMQTSVPHIWALGDVAGSPQFTYISLDDQRILLDQWFGQGQRRRGDRAGFAYAAFLEPPFAHAGLHEAEARQQGLPVKVLRMPAAAIPKTKVLGQTTGLLQALVHADTGQVLGCTLFCAEAHEVINTVQLAIQQKLHYSVLRDHIFTHPTISEGLNDLFALADAA